MNSSKIKEFVYNDKPRRVYEMVSTPDQLGGIDMSAMTELEREDFEALVENFEKALTPYIKSHYRRFDPSKAQSLQ